MRWTLRCVGVVHSLITIPVWDPKENRSLLLHARSDPSVFYAVLADRTSGFTIALFTSSDGGETWSLLAGLGDADGACLPFVLDTSGPLTVYAQHAIDKGDSWEELCTAPGIRSLVAGPRARRRVVRCWEACAPHVDARRPLAC